MMCRRNLILFFKNLQNYKYADGHDTSLSKNKKKKKDKQLYKQRDLHERD